MKSDITKNKDYLKGLTNNKEFILDLSSEEFIEKRKISKELIL